MNLNNKLSKIDKLIINNPYSEPKIHWDYDRTNRTFSIKDGRRPAGYIIASGSSKSFDDPGVFVEIPLVNQIRGRVKEWREKGYLGVSGVTRNLLAHWNSAGERHNRFFFCQLEAIETLIWLTEAAPADKVGIDIPTDGGNFGRWCTKMATGTGKTVVMAMLIAWQVLNKAAYPQDKRFSKNIMLVAPGLTVKKRLSVLQPSDEKNYYQAFSIVPPSLIEQLRQARVLIHNWHSLAWEKEEQVKKRKSVDKRGAKSLEAYTREILGDMQNAKNIIVINDEAHHAWRVPSESKLKGVKKDEIEESTIWVGGLDKLHISRGILQCFDFSATPFAPSGKKSTEEALFDWIVSDFGLYDAIESGLVKTPRVVVKDDGQLTKDYKSRLYHIYMDDEVRDDLNRKASGTEPLPDLIANAYYLLGKDWLDAKSKWLKEGHLVPPVMITVANRTETAARIEHAFKTKSLLLNINNEKYNIDDLLDSDKILHIDSEVLKKAEAADRKSVV